MEFLSSSERYHMEAIDALPSVDQLMCHLNCARARLSYLSVLVFNQSLIK